MRVFVFFEIVRIFKQSPFVEAREGTCRLAQVCALLKNSCEDVNSKTVMFAFMVQES